MFSRILLKLIDQSITPAILLLSTRIISVVLVSRYFDINFTISGFGFEFNSTGDYILVNSYSIFFMILVLTVGLLYILLKTYIFHDSHITPGLTAKLFTLKLSSFIQSSFELYSQGSIWLSYSYLIMLVSGLMAFYGLLYTWVFYVSFVMSVLSTILLIVDVENELTLSKAGGPEFDGSLEYIEEGEDDE